MALLRRQSVSFEIFDDQSSTLWNSYVGNWTHYTAEGFNNDTITATPNTGASFSFVFAGSQAWLYGGLLNVTDSNGNIVSYPTADYEIDGVSGESLNRDAFQSGACLLRITAGSQKPWFDETGAIVYFQTPPLAQGTHTINVTVTSANLTDQYILDYFIIVPTAGGDPSGVETSRNVPSPTTSPTSLPIVTTTSAPVGPIVGGVVGGIAGIALLIFALWYFVLRKRTGGRAYYFEKPTAGDMLAGETLLDNIDPYDATTATPAPSSGGFGGPGAQSAYSDNSSNQPLNPAFRQTLTSPVQSQFGQSGPSEGGLTYTSGTSSQQRVSKAALIAQRQDTQPPVQYQDSGARFNENGELEAGPSQLPTEVPPTYTPN